MYCFISSSQEAYEVDIVIVPGPRMRKLKLIYMETGVGPNQIAELEFVTTAQNVHLASALCKRYRV